MRTLQEKFHCELLEEKKEIGVMKEKPITERLKECVCACVSARMCNTVEWYCGRRNTSTA